MQSAMVSVLIFISSLSLMSPCIAATLLKRQSYDIGLDHAGPGITTGHRDHGRKLHGRFLQITDIHPDPFYKIHSVTDEDGVCHRGNGSAGFYGAEKTDCDTPFSLVNATFHWINANLKDNIDFIIWTGDSARHDNDEKHPRSNDQVLGTNQFLVDKFSEVFGRKDPDGRENGVFEIPIIPTFGNNDILPHNIFYKGPNSWTKSYAQIWRNIIPEEQRHAFDRGGWFYVEVIPSRLAVFSLNTLYFFDSNSAVDGCASTEEPGYEQMEWLRIQLGFLRKRGMKAILTGHVPPARSHAKSLWDESCWQKYTIWMQQYRDVVVGSIYGHMNIEHFLLQDFRDIDYEVASGSKSKLSPHVPLAKASEVQDEVGIQLNVPNYINSLRRIWAKLPSVPESLRNNITCLDNTSERQKDTKEQRDFFEEVGGRYAERFSVSVVAASLVPNYYPTLRVYEYNITGLEDLRIDDIPSVNVTSLYNVMGSEASPSTPRPKSQAFDTSRKSPRLKKPHFTVPDPPSKFSPPGPAYSPQTFSWLGYTVFFANLTHINDNNQATGRTTKDRVMPAGVDVQKILSTAEDVQNSSHQRRNFTFEVEYKTQDPGDMYMFQRGLMVKEWVGLAATVGDWSSDMEVPLVNEQEGNEYLQVDGSEVMRSGHIEPAKDESQAFRGGEAETEKKKKRKKKTPKPPGKRRRQEIIDTWYTFAARSVVGTMDRKELRDYFSEP